MGHDGLPLNAVHQLMRKWSATFLKMHINKRLQASDKPSSGKKRDISESLNRLSQRLDDINKMSPDQLNEISQACSEIGKELSKIEEEVNSLHGLLPPLETDRDPIKV